MQFDLKSITEHGKDVLNCVPFLGLAVKEVPSPMVTQVMQPVIIAVVLGFFMEIKTIPELKADIAVVKNDITMVKNQVTANADDNKQLRSEMRGLMTEVHASLDAQQQRTEQRTHNSMTRKDYEDMESHQNKMLQAIQDTIKMQRNQQR